MGFVVSEQLQFEEEEINIVLRRAWDRALRTLATRVNKPTFETHIRAIRPLTLSELRESGISVYHITLAVPSAFTREWVEKRHSALISDVLAEILDQEVQLTFAISPRDSAKGTAASRNPSTQPSSPGLFDAPSEETPLTQPATRPLDVAPVSETPQPPTPLGSRVLQLLMEDDSAPVPVAESDTSADASWMRTLTSRVAQSEQSEAERAPTPKLPVPTSTKSIQGQAPVETGSRPSGLMAGSSVPSAPPAQR